MFKSGVSAFTYIDEIDPASHRHKIKVRILRLWKGFQRDTGSAIEMVLVDEKGSRIHATVEDKVMGLFKSDLIEGGSIIVDTFQLVNNGYEYKTTPQMFKISFFRTTSVTECDDFPIEIPEKYFADYPKIISGVLDQKVFVDVIGHIISAGPLEDIMIRQKKNIKMDIELRDTTDARMVCTLWGNYAEQVKKYADEHKSEPIICVLRLAQIKEFRGKWSISNSYNATKILLDPRSTFFDDFRSRITSNKKLLTMSYKEIETPVASSVTLYEEFFVINPRKSIGEILIHDEELVCVTIGKVEAIVDPYRWCYIGCTECGKKVDPYPLRADSDDPPMYSCEQCNKNVSDVTPRYRLLLRVSDSFVETKFLFFDHMAEKLLGKSAAILVGEVPEDNPSLLPSVLADLVGKRMLFKIRIGKDNRQTKSTHYVVQKFADNEKMVREFENGPEVISDDEDSSDASVISTVIAASKNRKTNAGVLSDGSNYNVKKKIKIENP